MGRLYPMHDVCALVGCVFKPSSLDQSGKLCVLASSRRPRASPMHAAFRPHGRAPAPSAWPHAKAGSIDLDTLEVVMESGSKRQKAVGTVDS